MEDKHYCIHEKDWGTIETKLDAIMAKVAGHIEEGDKQGGFRDRIIYAETAIKTLQWEIASMKKNRWAVGITAGLIGGLCSQITPEIFQFILRLVIR